MLKHDDIEQRSAAWHQKRKVSITGTDLKSLMGNSKTRQDAIYEKIAQRLSVGVEEDYESPMDRGIRLEDEAIAMFELETGEKVERTGFCQNDDNTAIAYSPDGLIGETKDVEIKCPGGKNYVKMWLTNKVPEEYYWQLVQAFVVNPKLEKRYFVGYNPDIPVHSLHIIEVERKDIEADIHNAEVAQKKFLLEVESALKDIIKF